MPDTYPLSWPAGRRRNPANARRPTQFRTELLNGRLGEITLPAALDRLEDELRMTLGVRAQRLYYLLSTNIPVRLDGKALAWRADAPDDPGAALYFTMAQRDLVFACDRWTTVPGNIAAIAAHMKAMRAMTRWGVGEAEQAFAGYMALPGSMVPDDWRAALDEPATLQQAEATYRSKMLLCHPDTGGTHAAAAALNAAIAAARKEWG